MAKGITISGTQLTIILGVMGLFCTILAAIIQPTIAFVCSKIFGAKNVTKEIFDISLKNIRESLLRIEKSVKSLEKKMERHIQRNHVGLVETEEDED